MMRFEAPRKLLPTDSLDDFHCGVDVVDAWAHARAREAEARGTAVVYVVFSEGEAAGLYSLCSHSVDRADVQGGWLRRNAPASIPAILLGMLGVDERFKGNGLGRSMLADAIRRSIAVSEQIGAKALLADPVNQAARSFYEKYGFRPVPGMDRMFVSLKRQ